MSSSFALLTMGGTIDKDYFDALSDYQVVDSTLVSDASRLGLELSVSVSSIAKKDSLELGEADRQTLASAVAASEATKILVSHGTDTMVDTAQYLELSLSKEALNHKTIILFGAMRPSRFKDSDGPFNFAFALGAAQAAQPGVYIAMSARLFAPHDVVKNRDAGRFEAKA